MDLIESVGKLAVLACDQPVTLTLSRGIIILSYGDIKDKKFIGCNYTDEGIILQMQYVLKKLRGDDDETTSND
jgi:hypothetical protein